MTVAPAVIEAMATERARHAFRWDGDVSTCRCGAAPGSVAAWRLHVEEEVLTVARVAGEIESWGIEA